MALEDFLEAYGTQANALGLPNRSYSSPLQTGAASVLGGFATGMKLRRALADAKRLKAARDQFSNTLGIDYDLFSKLPSDAQSQILKNKGLIDDPANHPLDQFGGRTMTQLENQGIPSTMSPALGTGVMEGLGGLNVGEAQPNPQARPGMIPLKGLTGKARADEMHNYLNPMGAAQEPTGMTAAEYRQARLDQMERDLKSRIDMRKGQREERLARIKYIRAGIARRQSPDEPVDDWEIQVARSFGIPIPEGVKPTRRQFDTAMKNPKNLAVGSVVTRSDEMATAIHLKEVQHDAIATDKQIEDYVKQQGADLVPIAGQAGLDAAVKAVKAHLKGMRAEPNWTYKGAEGDETDIPDSLDEQDDAGTESDDSGGEDDEGDY